MKSKTITLQQTRNGLYTVDQLVNTVSPTAGSVLSERDVELLIRMRDTKVVIKRAKP